MKRFLSFFLAFTLSVLFAAAGEKVTYRYAPELGKALHYDVRTETEMTLPQSSDSQGMHKLVTTMKMEMTPTATKDGVTTVVTKILDMTIDADGKSVAMPAQQQAAMKKMLTALRVITQVNEQGATVGKPKYEGLSKELAEKVAAQTSQMNFSDQVKYFPKYAIGEGDTWKSEVNNGNNKVNLVYTLVKLDDAAFLVKCEGTLTTELGPGVVIAMDINGTVSYDRKTGVNVVGGTKLNINGSVEAKGSKMPMNLVVTM